MLKIVYLNIKLHKNKHNTNLTYYFSINWKELSYDNG